MKNYSFVPDIMFENALDIGPELLIAKGIRAVVLDIDNTLVTYGVAEPTDEVFPPAGDIPVLSFLPLRGCSAGPSHRASPAAHKEE